MTESCRSATGGRIERDRKLSFTFDGTRYAGCAGDTLASALLANGVHLVGRSFKYHRPRGILSGGAEEPNALVTIDRGPGRITPNLRATQLELYEGLCARSQNCWPSPAFDIGAIADRLSPLLSAGFYYKTFMWPPSFWRRLYEPAIRAAAGLGRAPQDPDPDRYLHHYAHCEVLVIGAGPAGLAAALAASAGAARVILCDEQAEPGGSLLAETDALIEGRSAATWLADALATLRARGNVTLLPRTTAFGWFPDNFLGLAEQVTDHLAEPDARLPRERLWQVRARDVVIAAGAIERPLVFPHNDRPGIMLADAARTYLQRYGVRVGTNAVVVTSDDSAYRAALALHAAGVTIAAVADRRAAPEGPLIEAARAAGIAVHAGTGVAGTSGRLRVRSVRLSGVLADVPCDTLLMCGGWTPSVHLHSQSRGRLRFDAAIGAFVPEATPAQAQSVGACAGVFDLAASLDAGYAAGQAAVRAHPAARHFDVTGVPLMPPGGLDADGEPHAKAFVDLQNDVTTKDLRIATREGFRSIEHVKRYTTAGMATDQGKTSNVNTLGTVSHLLGQPMPAVGHTTFRMPYTPVTFGTLAGAARGSVFEPVRHAPLHDWAVAQGAMFEDVGTWKRARCFPRAGEDMHEAVARECRAVRNAVGMLDASTLGKIEVIGPDAAEFLDLLYVNDVRGLAPGSCRYALLLRETGFVLDDGIIARLAHDRFHITTTTGGAAAVLHHMEDYLQTEFPHLRVWLTSTTEHWAVIAVQGPRAHDVLAPLAHGIDLATMPHMSVREATVCGVATRLFRVSFTGEPGFEINIPADRAAAVWDALLAAGAPFGITPYGTEAMHVLRAECGYIVVGQETDGTVTPGDLGLNWMIGRSKREFVGKRSLDLPDLRRPDRRQLVGLRTLDPRTVPEEGAQLVDGAGTRSLGHVTSAYWSATQQRSIALALLAGGRARVGTTVRVVAGDRTIEAQAIDPASRDARPDEPAMTVAPHVFHPAAPTASLVAADCPDAALTLLRPATRLSVRAGSAAAATLGAALGVLLGSVPGRVVTARDRAALWLGPDEWLVVTPAPETRLAAHAAASPGAVPGSVVDISQRHVAIELAGPRAAWCINAFNALDLDPHVFPIDACARTLFGRAEIVLWRTAAEVFRIEVARSLAPYAWACLEEARRELMRA
ncbi:MAG TPA: sarcosine oxidase subunit alpha family protein [Acetobacteraceae bacterium]|jgi:sarcosine oxidase subunit alpha